MAAQPRGSLRRAAAHRNLRTHLPRCRRHRDRRIQAAIGADGARSEVARQTVPGAERTKYVFAYHEIIRTPAAPPQGYDGSRCDVYYRGSLSPDFYGWVFPHGDTLSVGTGSADKGFSLRGAVAGLRVADNAWELLDHDFFPVIKFLVAHLVEHRLRLLVDLPLTLLLFRFFLDGFESMRAGCRLAGLGLPPRGMTASVSTFSHRGAPQCAIIGLREFCTVSGRPGRA